MDYIDPTQSESDYNPQDYPFLGLRNRPGNILNQAPTQPQGPNLTDITAPPSAPPTLSGGYPIPEPSPNLGPSQPITQPQLPQQPQQPQQGQPIPNVLNSRALQITPPTDPNAGGNLFPAQPQSSTPSQDRLRDFLSTDPPTKENSPKLTKMQRLGAILAGAGVGFTEGPSKGLSAAKDVIDSGYNDALEAYKNKYGALEGAAKLESDSGKTGFTQNLDYAKLLEEHSNNSRLAAGTDSTIATNNARIQKIESDMSTQGYNFTNRETDGHRIGTKMTPTGPQTIDLGKYIQTPDEKANTQVSTAGRISRDITLPRDLAVQSAGNDLTTGREKSLADYNASIEDSKNKRNQLEQAARDSKNPDRVYTARILSALDVLRAHPELKDKIKVGDNGTPTGEWDKSIDPLMNIELNKYNANPGGTGSRFQIVSPGAK